MSTSIYYWSRTTICNGNKHKCHLIIFSQRSNVIQHITEHNKCQCKYIIYGLSLVRHKYSYFMLVSQPVLPGRTSGASGFRRDCSVQPSSSLPDSPSVWPAPSLLPSPDCWPWERCRWRSPGPWAGPSLPCPSLDIFHPKKQTCWTSPGCANSVAELAHRHSSGVIYFTSAQDWTCQQQKRSESLDQSRETIAEGNQIILPVSFSQVSTPWSRRPA